MTWGLPLIGDRCVGIARYYRYDSVAPRFRVTSVGGVIDMPFDPATLRYSREHEWIARDENDEGSATIGITEYAQGELGDVVYVDLPQVGAEITQFAPFGEIESVKSVSDLFAPVSGAVLEANPALEDKPELVNEDPYGEGWIIRITVSDQREIRNLLSHDEYESFLTELAHGE